MNYGQFVRFAEKTRHLRADKLTQITVISLRTYDDSGDCTESISKKKDFMPLWSPGLK